MAMTARVVILEGAEYDLWRRDDLQAELDAVEPSENVILDFRNTSFIDAGAITLLVKFRRRMRRAYPDARVGLSNVAPAIRRLLRIAQVENLFEFPS